MRKIDRVRFRDAIRVGAEEIYFAYNGGAKDYDIMLDGAYVRFNGTHVPMSNVIQFTLAEK
jgi:hypothetical protein